jgi:hypothetical protein
VAKNFKERIAEQMGYVCPSAGIKIINTQYFVPLIKKPFTQIRPQETASAGY